VNCGLFKISDEEFYCKPDYVVEPELFQVLVPIQIPKQVFFELIKGHFSLG
jgi:hypothetical protein